jgi:hypothetical protein
LVRVSRRDERNLPSSAILFAESQKNFEVLDGQKKNFRPLKIPLIPAKKAQRFSIPSSLFQRDLPPEKKFPKAIFLSKVQAQKNHAEEKFFLSAPIFQVKISRYFEKNLSAPRNPTLQMN